MAVEEAKWKNHKQEKTFTFSSLRMLDSWYRLMLVSENSCFSFKCSSIKKKSHQKVLKCQLMGRDSLVFFKLVSKFWGKCSSKFVLLFPKPTQKNLKIDFLTTWPLQISTALLVERNKFFILFGTFFMFSRLLRIHRGTFLQYLNNVITFLDSQWFLVKSLMGCFIFYSLNLREIASFFIHFLPKFFFYFNVVHK